MFSCRIFRRDTIIQMAFYGMLALGVAGIAATVIFLLVYCKLSTAFREVRILLKRTLCSGFQVFSHFDECAAWLVEFILLNLGNI